MQSYDMIILGAGPSGLSAALYSARAKLKTLVVSGPLPGGQITKTNEVDNYPGFPEGISGTDLGDKFRDQSQRYGAEIIDGKATQVNFLTQPYTVNVGEEQYNTRSVIIATGMNPKKLEVLGEDRFYGHGVFTCSTCDSLFYEDLRVAVIGGGDSALQEALDLAKYASNVIIVNRKETLKAGRYLTDKARNNKKISFQLSSIVEEISGDKSVSSIRIRHLDTNITEILDVAGVLIAIGWEPNTGIFIGQLELDNYGYIIAEGTHTSKPGIFIAGDLIDKVYRQVVTSCASGCIAAIEAERYLTA